MSQKENIFHFNHIDKSKTKEEKRFRRSKSCMNITISNIGVTKKPINTSKN